MVKVSDCTCCDCESATEKEQIKERALSSINKVYTFDNRTFWPDGTGMVTIPLPTQEQLNTLATVTTLTDQVTKNTAGIATNAELIAGEQTQIDSLKTTLETSYQAIVQKGSANGYAGLDNNARVPLAQLYAGTSANQVPLIGKQLLANEMLVVDADGLTVRSKPIVQTLSFRGIYPAKSALPSEGNVSGDYAIVSDGTAQDDTGYYVWGYNTATSEYEWVWTILFDANSYQLISNLVTEISDSSDDSHYPSAKAVKDYHDASVGTLEQEITDINNDLATVQTTLNEHTTGIANAISQAQTAQTTANGCFNEVSNDGSAITFTKPNGESTDIDISSINVIGIDIPLKVVTVTLPSTIPYLNRSTEWKFYETVTRYNTSLITPTKSFTPTFLSKPYSEVITPYTEKTCYYYQLDYTDSTYAPIINLIIETLLSNMSIHGVTSFTATFSSGWIIAGSGDLFPYIADLFTFTWTNGEISITNKNTLYLVSNNATSYEYNVTTAKILTAIKITNVTYE